jgi:hypothetical protein
VGIEAAARGIPMAAFASSPYAKAVYHTIEPSNKEDLNNLINDLFEYSENFNSDDLRKVYRFINAYIYKLSIEFKSFGIKNHFGADIRIKSFDDLIEGKDPTLDRVCDHIIKGTPLADLPTAEDLNRSRDEEDVFFRNELSEIKENRRRIRQKSAIYSQSRLNPAVAVIHISSADSLGNKSLFSAWMKRSRYKNLIVYSNDKHGLQNYLDPINSFPSIMNDVKENYILITNELIYYDESFISSAIDTLLDDQNLEIKGIFSGGWITSGQGNIEREIFTERVPASSYQEAINILPLLKYPQILLSFCLFRKNAILEMFKTTVNMPLRQQAETVFGFINGPTIHRTNLPMVLIKESSSNELAGK